MNSLCDSYDFTKGGFQYAFRSYTPQFYNENKQLIPNSIATIESVMINNRKQTLLMRGQNVEQPILLCCHGMGWHKSDLFAIFKRIREAIYCY